MGFPSCLLLCPLMDCKWHIKEVIGPMKSSATCAQINIDKESKHPFGFCLLVDSSSEQCIKFS